MVTTDDTFIGRTRGVGTMTRDEAERLGAVGPTARASGVPRDVRVDAPYAGYPDFPVKLITETAGDLEAKFIVRLNELYESYRLIREILDEAAAGRPLGEGAAPAIPAGEAVSRVEAPRGELFYFLRSAGGDQPRPRQGADAEPVQLGFGAHAGPRPQAGRHPDDPCRHRSLLLVQRPAGHRAPAGEREHVDLGRASALRNRERPMNITLPPLVTLFLLPGGLFLLAGGLAYEWADRKLVARFQNRLGPRWFQPLADIVKLLAKEDLVPDGVNPMLFNALPIVALAGALTAALYVPMLGLVPQYTFRGDLVVTLYLLSLMTLCMGVAGANTMDRFSIVGATRALTQMFSYEAPFLLALLGPSVIAGTWQISGINQYAGSHLWLIVSQPVGFVVALIGLMGKLELPPFDAPEAETEIVAGALTEYSGRGFALFKLGRDVELFVGLTLVATFYLGGIANPLEFLAKTLGLLLVTAGLQSLFARLRIDQTVGLWWRIGAMLALAQLLFVVFFR